jgi:hypothetical protein
MKTQKQDLEHLHRIHGGPAHAQAISLGQARSKPLEIDLLGNLTQIMIFGHHYLERLLIEFGQWLFIKNQHGSRLPRRRESPRHLLPSR